MRQYLNLNTIILVVSGLLLMVWGAWKVYRFRDYIFGGGLFFIGAGNFFFGITNGFTDPTPRGRFFFKAGIFAYLAGLVSVGYSLRYLI